MTKYHQNLGAYLFIKLLLTFVSSTDKVLEIFKIIWNWRYKFWTNFGKNIKEYICNFILIKSLSALNDHSFGKAVASRFGLPITCFTVSHVFLLSCSQSLRCFAKWSFLDFFVILRIIMPCIIYILLYFFVLSSSVFYGGP